MNESGTAKELLSSVSRAFAREAFFVARESENFPIS